MSFTVDVHSLGGLPAQLDRLREDATLGYAYVDHCAKLSYGGLLDRIIGGHEGAVHKVENYLDRLAGPVACINAGAFGRTVIVEATELAASLGLGHRWDPYEKILKPITGDWNGLRKCKA